MGRFTQQYRNNDSYWNEVIEMDENEVDNDEQKLIRPTKDESIVSIPIDSQKLSRKVRVGMFQGRTT